EAPGLARRYLCHCRTPARPRHGVEIDRMNVTAIFRVGQIDRDRIPYPYAYKWTGYLVVECPVFVSTAIREATHNLRGFQVECHVTGLALTNRFGDGVRVLRDIGARAFRWLLHFAYDELAGHARCLVPGQCTEILEAAAAGGAKHD